MQPVGNVLIVDDAAENIQILAQCLKGSYRLQIAKSGRQALSIVGGETTPDIILLDIEMPEMDGYEVCRQLKDGEQTKDIPVIFITARSEINEEEYGLSLGAVDYITKPISPAIVQARVKTHMTIKQQRDRLISMAMYDQLTGLYNRHYLFDMAERKISRAIRHHEDISVMILDIDFFKKINDTHGHAVGDSVLQAFAALLGEGFRKEDTAARVGGEEFVVIMDRCDLQQAKYRAEHLCEQIATTPMAGLNVTCSIGVAQLLAIESDFHAVLNRADHALYMAKESGRNKVVLASD